MSYWVLTQGAQVISRTPVQRVTNQEKETDEVKESIKEYNIEISRRFEEEEDLTYDGAKPNPADWSEYLEHDPDFQEEFDNIINDSNVPEADDGLGLRVVLQTSVSVDSIRQSLFFFNRFENTRGVLTNSMAAWS